MQPGDCIESIAAANGLFWETIWNDPRNQALRSVRKDRNLLLPGDRVFVPERRLKEESCPAEARHRFRRKGVPSRLRLILQDDEGNPRDGESYVLEVDGRLIRGKTDAKGLLQQPIPPTARRGRLIIGSGLKRAEFNLRLGQLDPVAEITGLQSRLRNLGYECAVNGSLDGQTRDAIQAFQAAQGLDETGDPDPATLARLEQAHRS